MIINFLKKMLQQYQRSIRIMSGLHEVGVLHPGSLCSINNLPPEKSNTHGDVVHPCVRFVEKGFEGHQWWMIYTPYYDSISAMENPILCYADSEKGKAPTAWTYYCTIREQPVSGYNSDPTMLFSNDNLYVFWRENYTPLTQSLACSRATIGCCVHNHEISYFSSPQLIESQRNEDREISPTFLPYDEEFRAYAVHVRFCSNLMYHLPKWLERSIYRLFDYTNKLYIYSRFKCFGVAIWKGTSLENSFDYVKTIRFKGTNWLYHPWHMDLFRVPENNEDNGKKVLYAIIQTNPQDADICLAYCEEESCFRFYKRPLITNKTIGMKGIYKPTALIVDNMFHLFYTARDNDDTKLNRFYVTSIPWKEMMNQLQ